MNARPVAVADRSLRECSGLAFRYVLIANPKEENEKWQDSENGPLRVFK